MVGGGKVALMGGCATWWGCDGGGDGGMTFMMMMMVGGGKVALMGGCATYCWWRSFSFFSFFNILGPRSSRMRSDTLCV